MLSCYRTVLKEILNSFFLPQAGVKGRVDVVYLIDGSSTVDAATFNRIKKLVEASLDYYNISKDVANVGLVQFGVTAEIVLRPKNGITKLLVRKYVSSISRPGGPRLINKALGLVHSELIEKPGEIRPKAKMVLVLITTGMNAEEGARDLISETHKLKIGRVDTVVLSLGNVANENELTTLAGRNVIRISSPEMLPRSYGLLERKIYESGGKKI